MIFSELYSAYYNTVAAIISNIIDGKNDEKDLQKIVADRAFGESALTILPSLRSGKWQLVRPDMTTPIEHSPTMPLTTLQKRWLKAISLDPRVKLFDSKFPELDGIEPLFTPDDYLIYDKYGDGDPFEDEEYIRKFRVVLDAVRTGGQIEFEMTDRHGDNMFVRCRPVKLEYSEKDDKFRVITAEWRKVSTVNLARIISCTPYRGEVRTPDRRKAVAYDTITVKVSDTRNTMERFMLHFAHFEKRAEKLDHKHYLVRIKYPRDDESEMVIRVLSFGPTVEVTAPDHFRELIVEKLKKQSDLAGEPFWGNDV